jgi:hypothetical protein
VITTDSLGHLLVAGQQKIGDSYVLLRLSSHGKVDPRFGRNGKVITDVVSDVDYEPQIVVDRRDDVLLGGWVGKGDSRFAVARYMP